MAILHTDYLGAHVTQWPPFSSSMHNSLDSFKCNKKKIQNKALNVLVVVYFYLS